MVQKRELHSYMTDRKRCGLESLLEGGSSRLTALMLGLYVFQTYCRDDLFSRQTVQLVVPCELFWCADCILLVAQSVDDAKR